MATLTPPVPLNPGQGVAWSFPTTAITGTVGAGNGTSVATTGPNAEGTMTMFQSSPLGNWYWFVYWLDFVFPSFPSGYTIDAVYPVIYANADISVANASSVAGPNVNMQTVLDFLTGLPLDIPAQGTFSGQYDTGNGSPGSPVSVGNTESDIITCKVGARLFSTVSQGGFLDILNVTNVALAVYFTPVPEPRISINIGNTTFPTN